MLKNTYSLLLILLFISHITTGKPEHESKHDTNTIKNPQIILIEDIQTKEHDTSQKKPVYTDEDIAESAHQKITSQNETQSASQSSEDSQLDDTPQLDISHKIQFENSLSNALSDADRLTKKIKQQRKISSIKKITKRQKILKFKNLDVSISDRAQE